MRRWVDDYSPGEHIDLKLIRETAEMSLYEMGYALELRGGREVASTTGQMEKRDDWLVSRLVAWIHAAGGNAELIVTINGGELRFPLLEEI